MKEKVLGGLLAALTALSGCGLQDALHTAEVYDDLVAADVLNGPAATPEEIAMRTGSASYAGLGTVTASDGSTATAYLGDASFQVDFSAQTVNGQIVMYTAKGGLDPDTDPEDFFDQVKADPESFLLSMDSAGGTVGLTDGTFVGDGFIATATSDDLIMGSTSVVVTGGTVTAEFTGSDVNGIRSTASDVTGTINGEAATQVEVYFAAAEK